MSHVVIVLLTKHAMGAWETLTHVMSLLVAMLLDSAIIILLLPRVDNVLVKTLDWYVHVRTLALHAVLLLPHHYHQALL